MSLFVQCNLPFSGLIFWSYIKSFVRLGRLYIVPTIWETKRVNVISVIKWSASSFSTDPKSQCQPRYQTNNGKSPKNSLSLLHSYFCSPICSYNCGVVFLRKYILVFEKWFFSFDRSNMQVFTVNITRVVWPHVTWPAVFLSAYSFVLSSKLNLLSLFKVAKKY